MNKEVVIIINNKEVFKDSFKEGECLYSILFNARQILSNNWVMWIEEYDDDSESYFTNDIRNFITSEEIDSNHNSTSISLKLESEKGDEILIDILIK